MAFQGPGGQLPRGWAQREAGQLGLQGACSFLCTPHGCADLKQLMHRDQAFHGENPYGERLFPG